MKKHLAIFLVITLFFAPVILFCEETEKEKAPDFMLKTKEGVKITLSKIKNKVILLNFFAEKCAGCKDEVPYLNKFNENYKGYLQIFAVPFQEINIQKIEKVVKNFGINYPVLIDEKGLVAKGYKVSVLPFSVLISANKYIIKTYSGISEKIVDNLQQNIETEIKKIKEQKGNITLTIGEFKNTTKKAKEENLSAKVKNKIIEYLNTKENIVIVDDADYIISGSVSKFTDTFGVEVILSDTNEVLNKFSCGIEKEDYKILYDKLDSILQNQILEQCSEK